MLWCFQLICYYISHFFTTFPDYLTLNIIIWIIWIELLDLSSHVSSLKKITNWRVSSKIKDCFFCSSMNGSFYDLFIWRSGINFHALLTYNWCREHKYPFQVLDLSMNLTNLVRKSHFGKGQVTIVLYLPAFICSFLSHIDFPFSKEKIIAETCDWVLSIYCRMYDSFP